MSALTQSIKETVTPQPGTVPLPQKPLPSSSIRQEPLPFSRVIDGIVQDCSHSIANALELLRSCTNRYNHTQTNHNKPCAYFLGYTVCKKSCGWPTKRRKCRVKISKRYHPSFWDLHCTLTQFNLIYYRYLITNFSAITHIPMMFLTPDLLWKYPIVLDTMEHPCIVFTFPT